MVDERENVKIIGGTLEKELNTSYGKFDKFEREKVISTLLKDRPRKNIIDVGCSIGAWYNFLKNESFERLVGVDISKERLKEAARRGYETSLVGDNQKIIYKNDTFDNAICIDVLVHIIERENKIKLLKEVYRILKKGGCFVITFSNKKEFNLAKKLRGFKMKHYCNYYTLKEMQEIVSRVGFRIEKTIYRFPLHTVLGKFSRFLPQFGGENVNHLIFMKLKK